MNAPDVDVDLGPVPLRTAESLQIALHVALNTDKLSDETRSEIEQVEAMLDYKMSKAEFVATFAEPA